MTNEQKIEEFRLRCFKHDYGVLNINLGNNEKYILSLFPYKLPDTGMYFNFGTMLQYNIELENVYYFCFYDNDAKYYSCGQWISYADDVGLSGCDVTHKYKQYLTEKILLGDNDENN